MDGSQKDLARIPTHERDALAITCVDAVDFASEGEFAQGYDALLGGLHRAEELRDDCHEPWAGELVTRWEHDVERYQAQFGAKLG